MTAFFHIVILVCLLIDMPLIYYNGYLHGKRVQLKLDQERAEEAMDGLIHKVEVIINQHDPNRPRYLDRQ